jgi:hypothetical protein
VRNTGLKIGRRKASGFRVVDRPVRGDLAQTLAGLGTTDARVARAVLTRAVESRGPYGVRIKPQEAQVALQLAGSGVLNCEEKAVGTAAEPRWIPWRAGLAPDSMSEAKEALGILNADFERHALIAAIEDSQIAKPEVDLLRVASDGAPLRVPIGSRSGTRSWSVYSAALRAVAEWERLKASGVKPSSREVASRSLGSSKAWTPARISAFEAMVKLPFDQAMNHIEAVVKLRGPIRWEYRGAVGDGLAAHPWVGLPASMVVSFEIVGSGAEAALVIENEKTFEEVVRRTELSDHVLCLYGGGFLGEAEVALLRQLALPTFAWCDLDPKGIEIVLNIADRIERSVTHLLMEAGLLDTSPTRPASVDQVALAESLALEPLPGPLSRLAHAIIERRVLVEQESIHHRIQALSRVLTAALVAGVTA